MSLSKVAIVLPCYNSGEHIKFAIRSIIQNTQYPYKLILVVSKSEDKTEEICDAWQEACPDKIKVIKCKREGITKAINLGIKAAGNDNIYLTQDDVILPNLYGRDWLNELVKISKNIKKCGLITTIWGGGTSGPTYLDGFKWAGTWSLFIPRSTINELKFYEEI